MTNSWDRMNCEAFRIRIGEVDELTIDKGFPVLSLGRLYGNQALVSSFSEPEYGANLGAYQNMHLFMDVSSDYPPTLEETSFDLPEGYGRELRIEGVSMARRFSVWAGLGQFIPSEGRVIDIESSVRKPEAKYAFVAVINRDEKAFKAGFLGRRRTILEETRGRHSEFLPSYGLYEVKQTETGEPVEDLAQGSLALIAPDESIVIPQVPQTFFTGVEKIRLTYKPRTKAKLVAEPVPVTEAVE